MRKIFLYILIITTFFGLNSCQGFGAKERFVSGSQKLRVVTTTTMITDLLQQIGGDAIRVDGLMGAGIDPHLYKAGEGDVMLLHKAHLIFYNGLHLEGKLEHVFGKMNEQYEIAFAVGNALPKESLLLADDDYGYYDPHIWFDIDLWKISAQYVAKKLIQIDSVNADYYQERLPHYLNSLDELKGEIRQILNTIPEDKRVLITAHDAFRYFGRYNNFEVVSLQGISTVAEAGAADVKNLSALIYRRKIEAIFVESSVPRRNIQSLIDAVRARGFQVKIGGELFSDALGNKGSFEGTYIGMYIHNAKTIAGGLTPAISKSDY
jgi:manganese/zinc/iron transport system substrate-binding protein